MNNPHQNARTTFFSRVLMVQRVQTHGMSVSVVAQQLGVSRTTVYKWLKRYRGAGWEFLHVCVDDHSRLAYGELLPDQRAESCAAFLTRSVRWLGRQGIGVERVMTDNAGAYTSRHFQKTVKQLDVRHVRIRPYTPQTNGKAERFIRTSLKEWAYGQAYESSDERQEHLDPWLTYYNHQRPHASLNKKPPVSRLKTVNNLFDNYT